MGLRRKAREIAMKVMYILEHQEVNEFLGTLEYIDKYETVLQDLLEDQQNPPDATMLEFTRQLLEDTLRNILQIDELISTNSENWAFDRISPLDKSLLRIASAEILYTDTAAPIVINEALEIAHRFCSEQSGRFINGILNSINVHKHKQSP